MSNNHWFVHSPRAKAVERRTHGRQKPYCFEFNKLLSASFGVICVFVIMDDTVNNPDSDDEFKFDGFHREDLGQFSHAEVEEYYESSGSDTDGQNETEDKMEVQPAVTTQEWTQKLHGNCYILPFSVQNID